jgi:molybdate transport system regulatory protein
MNHCFAEPLVSAAPGGKKGGGAALTDAGRRVLEAYRALESQIMEGAAGERLEELQRMLKPAE